MILDFRITHKLTELRQNEYCFYLRDIPSAIVLQSYCEMSRETTRHKFKPIAGRNYNRIDRRGSSLKVESIEIPLSVKEEIRQRLNQIPIITTP